MLKVHPDRPALAEDMAPDALDRYYWYMAELVAYCREAGLPSSGQKHEVVERVRAHLAERPQPSSKPRAARQVKAPARSLPPGGPRKLALDQPVGPDYKCDAETRAFFESEIGPHFHFTAHLQRYRRNHVGAPLTYGDLAREWVAEFERRKDKNYKSTLMHTWEYNNFVRAYLADKPRNAGKTMKDAAAAWNAVRQSCGPRDYASSIARASPEVES
ncbi:hypothetical protein SAMN05192549_102270 [Duganella sacchari]|uniref:SAP domain-containing protein n=1 Tax=Duganella sacchari TaxID=551987 RepID=A0A1M7KYA5_9BURK|nr:DUF6434 domain-containing protein [Duganella sacchari]SHM70252.1 hypothetical protein SAMN05192549_102270 [Duganella sacchari]